MSTIPYNKRPRTEHRRKQSERYYQRTGYRRPDDRPSLEELSTPRPIPVTPEPMTREQHIPIHFTEQRDPLRIVITRTDRTGRVVKHVLDGDRVLLGLLLVLLILGSLLLIGGQP